MNCLTKLFQQKRRRIGYIQAFSGPMISKRDSSDQISLKDGYVGLSSINLNRINDAYVITYGNSIIENEKFHLQPDATYIICNYSIPDAKSHALEFKTNPRGNVKSVKEVK